MKNTLLIFLVFVSINIYSQQQGNTEHFTVRVREEIGDLNKDGLQDKIVLAMDTVNTQRPLKLQIFLLQSNRKLRLEFSSKDVFNPQYPNGKYGGNQVPNILIENGNLILYCEIKDVKKYYTFRYQNGKFELIQISKIIWDGKDTTTETKFDLVNGEKTEVSQLLGSKKAKKKKPTKIAVKALPTLQNFRNPENQFE
ncbi:hypothetical protein NAL32_05515 [Chryseobacterium sp. Ch-15]|uniref:Uncharacterized protein n=1 Tax=Chryseobacterium muglaense TaxID=2893752 RepID=A0A9Q3YU67_9FLAO|nr:hypothetical protein [Chryseobacterium muglaense]MBD3904073.1 hypothetical protein [Chryseobacterium muglaense]MCC9033355.1 hypothetical protein [Chryseobacterium muglaense]MCM2553850.1 hypothetical protein [Chryseobacterium muglaense]